MRKLPTRLLGGLIILKALLPCVILLVVLAGATLAIMKLSAIVSRQREVLSLQMKLVRAQVAVVEEESQRLIEEAWKIKAESEEFARSVRDLVKPLKGALNGLSQAMSLLARTIQNIINGIVSAVNKVPLVNIGAVRIPHYFAIPAFDVTLPNVDLRVSDEAYAAIREISVISYGIAEEAKVTVARLTDLLWLGLRLGAVVLLLFTLWLILAIVGYVARWKRRVSAGWQMLRGNSLDDALTLL